ncbi:unnamed protein product [Dovyalis caffra]|uniref:Uncharacterized protein n=1 Tax=Dovyalis caffra TaxID=77055 RepID=A0AAV1QNA6_9ROSI|nr:unnamed protein product [Dovyalis caffra]
MALQILSHRDGVRRRTNEGSGEVTSFPGFVRLPPVPGLVVGLCSLELGESEHHRILTKEAGFMSIESKVETKKSSRPTKATRCKGRCPNLNKGEEVKQRDLGLFKDEA